MTELADPIQTAPIDRHHPPQWTVPTWLPALPASLRVTQAGAILHVRLNRAHKRNALDDDTVLALETLFRTLDATVRVAVLSGDGDHFCAGLDLNELRERDAADGLMHSRMWHRAFDRIEHGPVPVIAVLHGAVVGGGLELASASHLRVAEESTFYALPEGQHGIFVGGGASVRVPRLIGVARMTDLMLTRRVVGAQEGQQIGLAQYLVPAGRGLATALDLALRVAENAPMTNFAVTQALPRIAEMGHDGGLLVEALMSAVAQSAPEAKTRLNAFLDKRGGKVRPE